MQLHQKNAELTSMQLRTNHLSLQLEALVSSDEQIRREKDQLRFLLAASEQDKVLLEARIQDITNFEFHLTNGSNANGIESNPNSASKVNKSHSILEDVRGKLLDVASQKVSRSSATFYQLRNISPI